MIFEKEINTIKSQFLIVKNKFFSYDNINNKNEKIIKNLLSENDKLKIELNKLKAEFNSELSKVKLNLNKISLELNKIKK